MKGLSLLVHFWYLLCLLCWTHAPSAVAVLPSSRPGTVHTLILTDCAKYQDWQTVAAAYAWRDSEQPGAVTRVANCNEKDTKEYDKRMLDYVQTHMAPQFAWNEELKDWYAAYNKPGAVVDWLKHVDPKEDWVVLLDSDMLLRRPFRPEEFKLERGWALAAHYDYLKGVDNDLALRHVPDIPPRNDSLAGPPGRRGDRVGGPYFMHREDIKKVAPLWLNWTKIMRADMEAYKDSGDTAAKPGDRIWIAEMYGYSFGAAKANVWHKFQHDFMLYPGYSPSTMPRTIHYGLIYDVDYNGGKWSFDKHWYFDFDVHQCTPWDLTKEKPKHGVFPPPPHPSKLPHKDYLTYYRDLIAIQAIALVNAAMCDYHIRVCPPSPQLKEVCEQALSLYADIKYELEGMEEQWHCVNHVNECESWAKRGECQNSKQYMSEHCRPACKKCTPAAQKERPRPVPVKLAATAEEVQQLQQQAGSIYAETLAMPLGGAAVAGSAGAGAGAAGGTAAGTAGASGGADGGAAAAHAADVKAKEDALKAEQVAKAQKVQSELAAQKQQEVLADTHKKHQEEAIKKHLEGRKEHLEGQQDKVAETPVPSRGAGADGADGAGASTAISDATAAGKPSEAVMRAKYKESALSYGQLVARCSGLKLVGQQLKDCIYAASLKLEYPGPASISGGGSGSLTLPEIEQGVASAQGLATGGLNGHGNGLSRASAAHDISGLHALQGSSTRDAAAANGAAAGGTSQLLLLLGLVLAVGFVGFQKIVRGRRLLVRKDQHRAE